MPSLTFPAIAWDGNTLVFAVPADNAVAYSEDREGSDRAEAPSGAVDAWIVGTNEFLELDARWIPTTDETTPYGHTATGWDGATGWGAFLRYARDAGTFDFQPDKDTPGTSFTCVLVDPPKPSLEEDGTRKIRLKIRTTDDSPFTGF